MARKERNNIDYFPHSVSHGKKMFYLRDKYKNDGYAVWFMLLEELGKADYHFLDLKDDIQLMYLSSEFKVSELVLNEIISTLVKFGEFDAELWNNEKILFNLKFIENISDAYKKRNNDCINKNSLVELLTAKGRLLSSKSNPKPSKSNPKGDGNTQSKLKDSKLKDSKEDETKEVVSKKDTFTLFWDHYHNITGLPKTDKTPTEKYWDKMSIEDQRKAYTNVKPYFDSLPIYSTGKPLKKARTYLADKNYEDEFTGATTPNKKIGDYVELTEKEKEAQHVNITWTYIHYENTYKKVHSDDKGNYIEKGRERIYL